MAERRALRTGRRFSFFWKAAQTLDSLRRRVAAMLRRGSPEAAKMRKNRANRQGFVSASLTVPGAAGILWRMSAELQSRQHGWWQSRREWAAG